MQLLVIPLSVAASALVCMLAPVDAELFATTHHDLLSAMALSAVDFGDVPKLGHLHHLHHPLALNGTHEDQEGGNVTHALARPRKKRTITLYPLDLYPELDFRYKVPLFQVYESTAMFLEIPISYHTSIAGVVDTGRESWDLMRPMLENAEALVSLLGVDGGACLRRWVCEIASSPSIRPHGFMGEVIQIFVNDLIKAEYRIRDMEDEVQTISKSLHGDYVEAGRRGKESGDCWKVFPECAISMTEIISDI